MAVESLKILCYIEDRAQEGFVRSIVKRIYGEEIDNDQDIEFDFLSPYISPFVSKDVGARKKFTQFVKALSKGELRAPDIVIIVVDGNCKGIQKETEFSRRVKDDNPYKDKIVFCIPDPHIEKWYLMDSHAFNRGTGVDIDIDVPLEKCVKDFYKSLMRNSLMKAGLPALAGGTEYAEDIVRNILKLYDYAQLNSGFNRFYRDLKAAFRQTVK